MKIVADENIPNLSTYFAEHHDLVLKPGRSICRNDIIDADVLIVRAVTAVNSDLLVNTNVRFVASVTSGCDHIDIDWLNSAGIKWYVAQGCNATAVAEYVVCVVAALQKDNYIAREKLRAAVVGVGRVGSLVAEYLKILGFDVLLCDPIRALNEPNFISTPLESLVDLDLISLHTPLTHTGEFATFQLIDKKILQQQKHNCVLINAGRGEVINFLELKEYGQHLYWCLDVWEHEPFIDIQVLQAALIATPHIAGYSLQSKIRGLEWAYQSLLQANLVTEQQVNLSYPRVTINMLEDKLDWRDVVLKVYDPRETTQGMRNALIANANPSTFDQLRKSFTERHEFSFITIANYSLALADAMLLGQLGFSLADSEK
jgi:erythronate-4-phosphate dehydrogenase